MKGILIDSTGDVLIENGKLIVGECSADVTERVLRAYPGEFKEVPTLGLFIVAQMNGAMDPFWQGKAKRQLAMAGLKVSSIELTDNGINVEIA